MRGVSLAGWLVIAGFLGWSLNLLVGLRGIWLATGEIHSLRSELATLSRAWHDLNRPGNDVLESYQVAGQRALLATSLRQYDSARESLAAHDPGAGGLESLLSSLDDHRVRLAGLASRVLLLAEQRETLRLAGADPASLRARETEAASTMARMDRVFQSGLALILTGDDSLLSRERRLDGLQQGNFRRLYLMLMVALVASALCWELLRRSARQRETIRDTAARLETILDNVADGIVVTDGQGTIQTVNPAYTARSGYSLGELVGRNVGQFLTDRHPGDPYDAIWSSLRQSGHWHGKIWSRRKNGGSHAHWLNIRAIRDDAGRALSYVGVTWDLRDLEASERMREEVLVTVSHELRTPLTSIRGALGLMAGGVASDVPEQADELVRIALGSCERLARLIDDIVGLGQLEAGRMRFQLRLLEMAPLLVDAIRANEAYAAQLGVEYVLGPMLPGTMVLADQDRILQVLTNLLSNAAKFAPEGDRVVLSMRKHEHRIRVEVTDHGSGISPEFRPQVFRKFARGNSSDARPVGGAGLGLSICKTIIEQLGGSIGFESRPHVRTTFYFDLPVRAIEVAVHDRQSPRRASVSVDMAGVS